MHYYVTLFVCGAWGLAMAESLDDVKEGLTDPENTMIFEITDQQAENLLSKQGSMA